MNIETLKKAQGIAAAVMDGVKPEQLSDSTPCESWDVAQLIDHVIGAQHWTAAGVKGEPPTQSGEGSAQGDYRAAFAAAAQNVVDAFSEDGALERTVNPGFGDMPATALLGLGITDTYVHAWDLATATGQEADFDPELAQQLLAASQQSIQEAFRGPEGAPFGPEQQAPAGATASQQLAAFLGRKV